MVVPPQTREQFLLSMVRRLSAHPLGQGGRGVPGYDAQQHFQRGKGLLPVIPSLLQRLIGETQQREQTTGDCEVVSRQCAF